MKTRKQTKGLRSHPCVVRLGVASMAVVGCAIGFVSNAFATTTNYTPVIYYTFDQDHTGMAVGGNGLFQLRIKDSPNSTAHQDGLLITPSTTFDTTHATRSYLFDADGTDGGVSGIGDGAAKFGNSLHLNPFDDQNTAAPVDGAWGRGDSGHVKVYGDKVTADAADYNFNSSSSNLFDRTGSQEWTMEFWFRAPATPTTAIFMAGHGRGPGSGTIKPTMNILVNTSGTITTQLRPDDGTSGATITLTSGTDFADAQWHHYALVRRVTPGGGGDFVDVYIDGGDSNGGETMSIGADESSAAYSWTQWGDGTAAGEPFSFFLGLPYYASMVSAASDVDGDPFDIDEFAYFNARLTVDELGWNGVAFIPEPSLIGLSALASGMLFVARRNRRS